MAQKLTSQDSLNAIITFLPELSNLEISKDSRILPINVTSATNVRTNVVSIVVSSIDALYYYILPILDSSKFYSLYFSCFYTSINLFQGVKNNQFLLIKKKGLSYYLIPIIFSLITLLVSLLGINYYFRDKWMLIIL